MAAVSRLEGNLVGGMIGGFEPRLQKSGQVLIHVFLEGLTCSTDLKPSRTVLVTHSILADNISMQTERTSSANQRMYIICCHLTGSILRMTRDFFFLVA